MTSDTGGTSHASVTGKSHTLRLSPHDFHRHRGANRLRGRRWGTTTDGDNHFGMGPALALVDATLSGDAEHGSHLRGLFGNAELPAAAAQVSPRALTLREVFDEELVMK